MGEDGRRGVPFRDPVNKERRFIPIRLDEAPIRNSLRPYSYASWLPEDRQQSYSKLLDACRLPSELVVAPGPDVPNQVAEKCFNLNMSQLTRSMPLVTISNW